MKIKKNVLGTELKSCCFLTRTGYFRDGYCRTGESDAGRHVVCAEMTSDFLIFTKQRGNDLSSPRLEFNFPGLKPGDRWCLCASRWKEAFYEGVAPPVILTSCEETALEVISIDMLRKYSTLSTQ